MESKCFSHDPWAVPAHGKAPVQQALVECVAIKHGPGLLPTSTFRSEFLRLNAEADAAGHPSDKTWVDRRCREFIRNCYGKKCFICSLPIDLHWDVEPIHRKLDKEHTTPKNHGSGVFHKRCWKNYKNWKTNKRRRTKYEARGGGEQLAVEGGQPVIEGGQPAAEGGEPAIEGGQSHGEAPLLE